MEKSRITDAYYYCSYTGSPVGFILGHVSCGDCSKTYELHDADVPLLIRRCFDWGYIRNAFGRLPNVPDTDFILIKNLHASGSELDGPAEFYMNIAFTTKDEAEFRSWLEKRDETEKDVAKLVRDSIEIEGTSAYGYVIRGDVLARLIKCSFGALFDLTASELEDSSPTFELRSASVNLESAAQQLNLTQPHKSLQWIQQGDNNWARYCDFKTNNEEKGFKNWLATQKNRRRS